MLLRPLLFFVHLNESNRENVRHWCGMLFIRYFLYLYNPYGHGCKQVRTEVSPNSPYRRPEISN